MGLSCRLGQHFLLSSALSILMTRRCLQMHAGHYHIFLMVLMIKFKPSSMQMSVNVLLSSFCKCHFLNLNRVLLFVYRYWFWHDCVIWCFSHPSPSVLIPALRTVGNIVTGDDVQTQVCSEQGFTSKKIKLWLEIAKISKNLKLSSRIWPACVEKSYSDGCTVVLITIYVFFLILQSLLFIL